MLKVIGSVVLAMVMFTLFMVGMARAEIVVNHVKGQKITDTNKTWLGDDKMCWAATAANMLAHAKHNPDLAPHYYEWFKLNISNKLFNTLTALRLYLTKNTVDPTEGFGFGMFIDMYQTKSPVKIRQWIKAALLKHTAVGITVTIPEQEEGHALTVYGYKYEKGRRWLKVVDSDDFQKKAYIVEIIDQGKLSVMKHPAFRGWVIVEAVSMARIYE